MRARTLRPTQKFRLAVQSTRWWHAVIRVSFLILGGICILFAAATLVLSLPNARLWAGISLVIGIFLGWLGFWKNPWPKA